MRLRPLLPTLLLALAACGMTATTVDVRPVASGQQSAYDDRAPALVLGRDEDPAMFDVNGFVPLRVNRSMAPPVADTNADGFIAVFFLGEKPSGGYAVDITRATMQGETLTFHATVTAPKEMATAVITSPWAAVSLTPAVTPTTFRVVDEKGAELAVGIWRNSTAPMPLVSTAQLSSAPSSAPSSSPASVARVALIALEDDGKTGKKIGCGDSVVLVDRDVSGGAEGALRELLRMKNDVPRGLTNTLAQSALTLDRISGGDVYLKGTMSLGGVCDEPRFLAQIEETVRANARATTITIHLNGKPLVLGERGEEETQVVKLAMFSPTEEDIQKTGRKHGCGTYVAYVERTVPKSATPLRSAIEALLAEKEDQVGPEKFFNPIGSSASTLAVKSVKLEADGTAVIDLTGGIFLVGTCTDALFGPQIEETAKQFPTVKAVRILHNGSAEAWNCAFSGSGIGCP